MSEEQRVVERQTAKIVPIRELRQGTYVKQEGWQPNYILTRKNDKVSRVNILGVVVTIPENGQSVFVDDGSEKIEVRSFEKNSLFDGLAIGDIILIIGRPREYNSDIYINGEVVRKISDKGWLEFRKKELAIRNLMLPEQASPTPQEPAVPHEADEPYDDADRILSKIKELDSGAGCDVAQLGALIPQAESLLEKLMLKGEIFEISPGKVKVLE